jgi:predicted Zn-dependent protease
VGSLFLLQQRHIGWKKEKFNIPSKGATIIGNGPESLKQITMIGNDLKLDDGVGVCGKDGQSVPSWSQVDPP